MTQTDASAAAMSMSGYVTPGISGVSMTFTPEQIQQLVVALNEPFDPARHEAVTTVPTSAAGDEDKVVGVVRRGYMIGDEVLRPAQVAVGKRTD